MSSFWARRQSIDAFYTEDWAALHAEHGVDEGPEAEAAGVEEKGSIESSPSLNFCSTGPKILIQPTERSGLSVSLFASDTGR